MGRKTELGYISLGLEISAQVVRIGGFFLEKPSTWGWDTIPTLDRVNLGALDTRVGTFDWDDKKILPGVFTGPRFYSLDDKV